MKVINIHSQYDIIIPASADGKELTWKTVKCQNHALAWAEKNKLTTIWYSRLERRVYGYIKPAVQV